MLIIICGLQGTGKTTVAKKIEEMTNAILLRTDVIRQKMFEDPKYTEEEKQKVYNEMFSRARNLLSEDKNVIMDATFSKRKNRKEANKIAEEHDSNFKIIKVVCPPKLVKGRMEKRSGDESKANFDVYKKYKKSFESLKQEHIVIDNSGSLENTYRQLSKHF